MNNTFHHERDQDARDMIATAVARIDRHEAICERDREENKAWRENALQMLEEIREMVKDHLRDDDHRFGAQQVVNSDLYVGLARPDAIVLRISMAANALLISAAVWLVLKLLHLV